MSYGYDGMGRRVRRRVNFADTGYLYDGANLLLEYDVNGVQAKYTYYPGSMAPHSVRRGGQTYYYATDMLGSVLALFNSSNTAVNQYTYLPFGEAQSTSETVANPLRFAGRELDASSGLYYNSARWYDPSLHASSPTTLSGSKVGSTCPRMVDVPGQGRVRMCEAAHACVRQRSTAGC